jgi:hypothetical protein
VRLRAKRLRLIGAARASPSEFAKRVLGQKLQLDPQLGVGFRGWSPDQYPLLRVAPAGHFPVFTLSVDVKAKLFGWLRLYRGHVAVVDRNTPADTEFDTPTRGTDALRFVSGFENLVLGIRHRRTLGSAASQACFGDASPYHVK